MAIKLLSGFEIVRFSDCKYEEITVEIRYKEQCLAQINKDKGINNLEIEIYSEYVIEELVPKFKFKLSDFLEAIDQASVLLKKS